MTSYRKYTYIKKAKNPPVMNRCEYILSCLDDKIKTANIITNNASKQCSNLKIFFLSFGLPVTAAWFTLYYSKNVYDNLYLKMTVSGIIATFYLLIFLLVLFLHKSFYKRQFQYRKVKESLETLKEKFIFELNNNSVFISIETFNKYFDVIREISNKSTKVNVWKLIKDIAFCLIPILIIFAFWIIVFGYNCRDWLSIISKNPLL